MARHLLDDDLASLTASLRQIRAKSPTSGPTQHYLDAAVAVVDRAKRTLQQIGSGAPPRREPTRLAELAEGIVQSHDPERRRLQVDITAAVVNVDATWLERILDRLVKIAVSHAAPGTIIHVRGGPDGANLRFSVCFDGRGIATSHVQGDTGSRGTGDWSTLLQLVGDMHGELAVGDTGMDLVVEIPRTG